jgi:hypothetical protein
MLLGKSPEDIRLDRGKFDAVKLAMQCHLSLFRIVAFGPNGGKAYNDTKGN